jgi:ribonuclease P protein component
MPADEAGNEVQVAYAVGRNVGTAVARNRWRRRLRVVASELSEQVQPGRYLIGLAPDVGRLTFDELRERVGDTMRRASGARQ